jgi:RNA polymerase sigma-70 factor (ECF subfamily)
LFFTTKITACSDKELLALFRKTKNVDYFAELYSRYIPLTYGLCLNYLKTTGDAQDVVMELFEEIQQKVFQHEVQTFHTWLYSVVKNHCIKVLRKNDRQVYVAFQPVFMESDNLPALFSEDNREENFRSLQKCMEKLPESQQVSIKLFFMSDKSYADIADITGFHLKSVKSYIQNGKRNLKICMDNDSKAASHH